MEISFQAGTLLLLIAAVVAIATRRLRLPYSVGLVATGIALAFVPHTPHVELTGQLLFTALLPPLLFEAAFSLPWPALRRELPLIGLLVTVGVLLSAAVAAFGLHWLLGWPLLPALLFGALIAATDPVSVIATFREARAEGRLLLLIESESLFNDGTAAVLFAAVLAVAGGTALSPLSVSFLLVKSVAGGVLCGALVAAALLLLAGRAEDHLVEITLTVVAAYGSFFLADFLGLSGVLATIAAGLVMGNPGPLKTIGARGREAIGDFWQVAAFAANSLIFLLIGMHEAEHDFRPMALAALVAVALVLLGRAAAVYPCCLLFHGSRLRVPARQQHVLF
jgi:CPA1 family monovalent cation:H+ antiporter